MVKLAYSAILVALSTTVAGAQSPAPPVAPRADPAPAVRIMTNVPADTQTVTRWYKQNVYDPSDSKIGEIMDVLVDREGKIGVLIVGVGGFVGVGEKDVALCHEHRRSTRRCATVREMKEGPSRSAIRC